MRISDWSSDVCSSDLGTAMIWITHDLAVVAGLADHICVMYAGRIVEQGPIDAVLDHPAHPYTHGLIGSVPGRNQRGRRLFQIPRSEEHTSELQSLMRISYAVFCLKKKKLPNKRSSAHS